MWSSFEKYLGKVIPECIKKILSETGFDDDLALENLKETDIKDIEHYVNEHLPTLVNSLTCCKSEIYKAQNKFEFLPGHRRLIIHLAEGMRLKYAKIRDKNSAYILEQIEHPLLNELISNAIINFGKTPHSRRYTDIIQAFATYIYMICGRYCYEIISSNLPIPQASTICMCSNRSSNHLRSSKEI